MDRTQMTFFVSFWDAINSMSRKDQLPVFRAVVSYGLFGEHNESLTPGQKAFFSLMQPVLDSSRRKAASGRKGGSKTEANDKQTASKTEANDKQTASEKEKENEKEKEKEYECKKSVRENTHTLFDRLVPEYLFSDRLQQKLQEWIRYKTERREPYKEQGLRSLLRQVENNATTYGEAAVCDLIDECMASNWKGIIFDRLKTADRNAPKRRTGNVFLGMLESEG